MQKSLALLLLGVALTVSACGGAETATARIETSAEQPSLTVRERIVPDYRMVSAILTNRDVGDARARISGRVVQISVKEGDTVRAGQLVAVIGDERISLEARAATASVAAAEAADEKAKQDLERAERLLASGAISQAAVDQARAGAKTAAAQLNAARAQSAAARAFNNQGQVVAPSAGVVTRLPVPRGAVVMAGEVVAQVGSPGTELEFAL